MDNPTLIAQLSALDAELEEGDITQKGYQKRRTLLLSQYGLGSDSESGSARSSIPSAGASGPPGPPGSSQPLVSPLAPSQASAPLASPSYPQFPHYANDGDHIRLKWRRACRLHWVPMAPRSPRHHHRAEIQAAEASYIRAFHAAIMCQLSVQLPSSATAQAT
jgi:hypothetical protein